MMTCSDTTAAPTPLATPTCNVIDTFQLGDETTCELLAVYRPGEGLPHCKEMLSRGRADKASMTEEAFQRFWDCRDKVPSKHWNRIFAFPETLASDGRVRYAHRRRGHWRHGLRWPGRDWRGNCVLVRLT